MSMKIIKVEHMMKAIADMELKVSILESNISQLSEDRQRLEYLQSSSEELVQQKLSSQAIEEKYDVLVKKIHTLEQINSNLVEDLQEWKNAYNEKTQQCEQNRDKYLRAQQSVEELRRQLEGFNKDSYRQELQANSNLQLANERFKEQLEELGHLPYILEAKQIELQESQSKLKMAEKTITALSSDLESCIIKCELLQKHIELERAKISKLQQEADEYRNAITDWKEKYDDLEKENQFLIKSVEKIKFLEECLHSKTELVIELDKQTEQIKQENERHVRRIKERAETQRRAYQFQIFGLEEELVQLRANLSTINKERDDTKQRMQNEISKLEQKFADAQLEIQNLKNHVDILKSSYNNMMEDFEDSPNDNSNENDSGSDNDSVEIIKHMIRYS